MSTPSDPPAVCPVVHTPPKADAGVCPVAHKPVPAAGSASQFPDACPMSDKTSAVFLANAQQQQLQAAVSGAPAPAARLPPREFLPGAREFPVAYKIREESGQGTVGDIFPDSRPIAGQRVPLSTLPSRSIIPKAAHKPAPTGAAGAAAASAPGALPKTASNAVVAPEDAPAKVATIPLSGAGAGDAPEALVCTSDALASEPADETWTFPSQQRFYNAMKKKGWNPREEDLPYIVSIHNTINEQCWRRVMEYEAFHADSCSAPKLLRFQGLPTDYSIKARVRSWLGYVLPFDRHDWVVDRCGKEVRYIIDFYNGPDDPTRPATVHLDVRPAPTPGGVIDRARMWWKHVFDI